MTKVLQYLIGMLSVSERDLFNMVFSLVLAIVIGIIISQLYKITHRG